MEPSLERVREVILREDGEAFLRVMRGLYRGEASAWDEAREDTRREIVALGLAAARTHGAALTSRGYIVGNVAKEYCNWLDHGRTMPEPRPFPEMVDGKDVLDLGCGFGRWLWEFQRTARSVTGLEMQPEFVDLGQALALREGRAVPAVHCAAAEDVEALVAPASMDLAFCRLMFSYVRIRKTLEAVATRLRPGGVLWMQVDTLRACCRSLLRERRPSSVGLNAFALVNSMVLMTAGVQLAVKVRGRMHATHRVAYPTLPWWRRSILQSGFSDFHDVTRGDGTLTFWARRLPPPRN